MKNKLLIKLFASTGIFIFFIYVLFLILPFLISPIIKNFIPQINDEIKKSTGLISAIEDVKILTTPKLTVGIEAGRFVLLTPANKEVLNAQNFQFKMSLLPLLAKRVEADLVKLGKIDANFGINKDGSFEIEKYFPAKTEPLKKDDDISEPQYLPFGLKLANKLPDIRIGEYNICFQDLSNEKTYIVRGGKTDVTDFVFNKSLKIKGSGSVILADREQFKYNLNVFNKIMPKENLNDFVFNPSTEKEKKNPQNNSEINILEVFKGLYNYKITANTDLNLTLSPDSYNGYAKIDNLSISPNGVVIPPSYANIKFSGNKMAIDSGIYTAENEKSTLNGTIQTGKKTHIDLNFKSNMELANLLKIVNAVALTFNIRDLQTLAASGNLDADFNIKSDLKTVNSNGYLKIPFAKVNYGLYNVIIDKINADIAFNNNNIDIKNSGFTILGQPLTLHGTITQDATADLHLTANNLNLKGLIVACGQAALLKDNNVKSGVVSLNAEIKGKLDSIKPTIKILLSNLNIKNIPSNTDLILPNTVVNIITDGVKFSGNAVANNVKAINPAATVNIPKLSANIMEEAIEITQTPVQVEKIRFNTSGRIKNYLTEKIAVDFITTGDIKSKLTGDINTVKQTLNLVYATTHDSIIIVPMFDKSKLIFNGTLNITGNMTNPILSGTIFVPSLNMPEIPVTINNLTAKLNGEILKGNATAEKFTSGGIVADNIITDFSMKGVYFYLKNLKGKAFDGKISGDIVYNMSNARTKIDFKGEDMNAEKAIEGSAGIKNALSGKLTFKANIVLSILPNYNDMMRSLTGNLSFNINNGAFGKIGRIENFLCANNIIGNTFFKTTVASFSNIAAIKNSAEFDYLAGEMSFSNGWANLKNIKSTGKSIAYYITGKYNLINNTANVTVLGRLNGTIVKLLGPIGELSAEKILSYIPKLGELTTKYYSELTADPDKERIKDIPELSGKPEVYRDFKVVFNGNIESTSSVKSFKWLTKADVSGIQQQSVSDTIKSLKTNLETDKNATVQSVKDTIDSVKSQADAIKDAAKEFKNLFKSSSKTQKTSVSSQKGTTQPDSTSQPSQTSQQNQSSQSSQPVQSVQTAQPKQSDEQKQHSEAAQSTQQSTQPSQANSSVETTHPATQELPTQNAENTPEGSTDSSAQQSAVSESEAPASDDN